MATAPLLEEIEVSFELGMDSNTEPAKLGPGRYARCMNLINRGGILQTRPGYRCLMALPVGRLQGVALYRPKAGPETMVFGVGGSIYLSDFPFKEFRQLDGVAFSSAARQLFFEQAEQAVRVNDDGSLTLVTPRNVLVIQDGGTTPPAVFDGTSGEHQRGANAIPIGGPMKWVGDRLWVARGAQLFASDINNPYSFVEAQYLSAVNSFILPGEITALARTPSVKLSQLLVFTSTSTTLIQAGVRDRTLWISTPDMQREIFSNIGCVSARSVRAHYGLLWWYSSMGLTSLDAAMNAEVSSKLPYRDAEMMDSKSRLSADLSGIACGSFENYLMVSVPYADILNRHTWVLDNTVRQNLNSESSPVWNSYWTGTRPVEWLTDNINGQTRVFHISSDYDGTNRLWEAFTPDRKDEGCPITWFAETRACYGAPQLFFKNKTFRYADIFLSEMSGTVDVGVFWAGATRGKYKRVLTKQFQATEGCFRPDTIITADSQVFSFKKQGRVIRTEDAKSDYQNDQSSCGVESDSIELYDESFQLLIYGSGPCAIRGFKMFLELPASMDNKLRTTKCEDETEENVVRFDGAASESNDFDAAWVDLSTGPESFSSVRTVTLTVGGLTEIGTGSATSYVSQKDADKIAARIATRKAAHELEESLPLIVSLGEAANV